MKHENFFTIIVICIGLAVAAMVLLPFFIWGQQAESYIASPQWQEQMTEIQTWAWLVIIGLLIADLVLPIPNSPLMAIAGTLYGVGWGCAIAAAGSVLAGLVAYGLAAWLGKGAVNKIATEDDRKRFQLFFDRWGGAGIAVSRAMPVMPEVLTVLAGLAGMRFGRFLTSLVLGALVVSLPLAWLGSQASDSIQGVTIAISAATLAVWGLYLLILTRLSRMREKDKV